MRAEVNLARCQRAQFTNQLSPVLHRGVVRLIGPEEPPNGHQFADGLARVDTNSDGKTVRGGRALRLSGQNSRTAQPQNQRNESARKVPTSNNPDPGNIQAPNSKEL